MKCPHCDVDITRVKVSDIDGFVAMLPKWKCFAYSCPTCDKVLNVEMNPLALQADQTEEILKRLGKP